MLATWQVESCALTSRFELSAAGLQLSTGAAAGAGLGAGVAGGHMPLICPVQASMRLYMSKLPADQLLPALRATLTLGTLEARLSPEQLLAVSTAAAQLRATAAAASGRGGGGPELGPGADEHPPAGGGGDGAAEQGTPGEQGCSSADTDVDVESEGGVPRPAPRLEVEVACGTMRARTWPRC